MIAFVGAYAYAYQVLLGMIAAGHAPGIIVTAPPGAPRWQPVADIVWQYELTTEVTEDIGRLRDRRLDLIVVAGWRRLIPDSILELAPTVGFHSAQLPEYPGRAPVPWAIVRGDEYTANTLLYLDGGVDTGDIIEAERIPIEPGETPDTLYAKMAASSCRLIVRHLPGLLAGTAPRVRQDPTRRGRPTTADGWAAWYERERLAQGHA